SLAVLYGDDVLEYVAADGRGAAEIVGTQMPITTGLAGYCARSGESIEVVNPQLDARFGRDIAQRTGVMPGRLLVVPLQTAGRTLGVLTVIDRDPSIPGA